MTMHCKMLHLLVILGASQLALACGALPVDETSTHNSDSFKQAEWGIATDGLRCQAFPTKAEFTATEEITFDFTIENTSTSNVYFMASYINEHFMDLILDGEWIQRADATQDWDCMDSFVQIEPGKTWITRITFSKGWHPNSPLKSGKAVLCYSYPISRKDRHPSDVDGWTGTLLSNEFDLLIK